jgi:hypothetical protein
MDGLPHERKRNEKVVSGTGSGAALKWLPLPRIPFPVIAFKAHTQRDIFMILSSSSFGRKSPDILTV